MLTITENFGWIIILPIFGLLFMTIWNALNKHSYFSEFASFMIALCVSMLCVLSVVGFFTQEHKSSQDVDVACQEETSSQYPQQNKFHNIYLPYMALMMSFLLLLVLLKIGLLADGINSFFGSSYGKKDTTTDQQKEKRHKTQRSGFLSNELKKIRHIENSNGSRR